MLFDVGFGESYLCVAVNHCGTWEGEAAQLIELAVESAQDELQISSWPPSIFCNIGPGPAVLPQAKLACSLLGALPESV